MSRQKRVESVFLNVPYDESFEPLYLAYIVGLTQLGLKIRVALAITGSGRLDTIIQLVQDSDSSIHDLSRVELSRGVPRFNMPLELGLALYRSKKGTGSHRVHIFDKKPYQAQRSTSDVNAIDAHIHRGSPRKVMIALRDIFEPTGSTTSVPEMLVSYRALQARLPILRHAAGGGSLYGAAMFKALVLFASVEVVHRRKPD